MILGESLSFFRIQSFGRSHLHSTTEDGFAYGPEKFVTSMLCSPLNEKGDHIPEQLECLSEA